MEWDDIIYLSLLIFSICVGRYFLQITDRGTRKWASTCVGVVLVFIVSGKHIIHPLLCTFINSVIIIFMDKRSCHLVSFAVQFSYLLFFRSTEYFGIPYPPAHTNLVQMMLTLKLVGLAFEVHDSAATQHRELKETKTEEMQAENEAVHINPGFVDIFHYTFCYIGVLTGPYYRYRTYWDWLNCPFSSYAPCLDATIQKIKYVPMYAGLYLLATHYFPIQYAETEEFYTERSVLYRIWFINPSFFIFRMRMYIGLVLSECVCCMAGLGAYPLLTAPRAGQGPTKHYQLLKELTLNPERAKVEKYDFETIHNIDPYGSDFVPTFRAAMKCWNSCIQYWLAVNVYKRFPTKKFRTFVTMFVSAFWHGVYAGYYLCICSAPMYLPVEDLYVKLYYKDATGLSAKIWEWLIWFFKMQAFSYMSIAFLLLRIDKTFYYWKSIYFAGHVVGLTLYVIGILIARNRKLKAKKEIHLKGQ